MYVGLALTSHNNSSLCAATFDNVTPLPAECAAADGAGWLGCDGWRSAGGVELDRCRERDQLQREARHDERWALHHRRQRHHDEPHGQRADQWHELFLRGVGAEPGGRERQFRPVSVTPQSFAPTGLAATTVSASQINLA